MGTNARLPMGIRICRNKGGRERRKEGGRRRRKMKWDVWWRILSF